MAERSSRHPRRSSFRERFSFSRRKSKHGASSPRSLSPPPPSKYERKSSQELSEDPTLPNNQKIAIVGIGCRYANGVNDVRQFWEMLTNGLDLTGQLPTDRFDPSYFLYPGGKLAGKMYNRAAGYLQQNPEYFDRQFFKLSPEEANHLDPQVCLLLEVVWESFEDAGIPPQSVRGSNTGVYIGSTAHEYGVLLSMPNTNINQYTNSGTNSCMSSNRISYEFDLRGPSFTIDTACSSSMYSIQLACEALRLGNCEMAIAGGVNITMLPVTSVGFCQAGMLAPDGKCKSFDESADGYARCEGAGALLLKPLQRALEDEDRIYAVIRGGALGNDGRTPGIANPSFDAQVSLIERACKNANVPPRDIVYVEAHGTGTQAGDRTEASAIGEALGLGRGSDHPPLYIGSVKSNFGHSEGASGVASVIKTALALHYGQIPRVVHFTTGNHHVDWDLLNIRVPTELTRWPKGAKKYAGCSSFGFGGANAHMILEGFSMAHPTLNRSNFQNTTEAETSVPSILFISGASGDALNQRLKDWHRYLTDIVGNDMQLYEDALYSSAVCTTHHAYRVGVIARSPRETAEQLRLKIEHDPRVAYNVIEGKSPEVTMSTNKRLVFVYSGMGTQWWGMARQLTVDEPRFRGIIKRIDKILRKCGAKWSLLSLLTKESDKEKINHTDVSQPALTAIQIALTELYRLWGVTPDAIIGHSVGEVAAAHVAGLLTLENTIRLIYTRGRQLRKTSGHGAMTAVLHSSDDVQAQLESSEFVSVIDVACINSQNQIVLSGDKESIQTFTEKFRKEGTRCISLKVDNAFHSYQQDDIKKDFAKRTKFLNQVVKESAGITPQIPMVSTISGQYVTKEVVHSSDYWWKNIRQTVLFQPAIQTLLNDGYTCFLEIGPHPVLSPAIRDIISVSKPKILTSFVTGSLRRPTDTREIADDRVILLRSLATLHVEGYPFDTSSLFKGRQCHKVSLPTYPWQRVLCSATTEESKRLFRFPAEHHPLLGERVQISQLCKENAPYVWECEFTEESLPWLKDHNLQGNIVLPAAAFTEAFFAASREAYPGCEQIFLKDVRFEKFVFSVDLKGKLEVTMEKNSKDAELILRSYVPTDNAWITNSKASLEIPGKPRASRNQQMNSSRPTKIATDEIRRRCPHEVSSREFYDRLWRGGFHLGETFHNIDTAYFSHDYNEALVYSSVSDVIEKESKRYVYHPALLDTAFQGFGICEMFKESEKVRLSQGVYKTNFQVPRAVKKIRLGGKTPSKIVYHVKVCHNEDSVSGNVVAADSTSQFIFGEWTDITFENVYSNEPEERVQLWRREWSSIQMKVELPLVVPKSKRRESRRLSAIGSENPGAVIIIKDRQGVSSDLKRRMEIENVVSVLDPRILLDNDERFRRVLRSLGLVTDVVLVSSLDVKEFGNVSEIKKDTFLESQSVSALYPLNLYKALKKYCSDPKPRVWIVTQGCQAVLDIDSIDPLMTSAGTFGLTIMHEDPNFQTMTVDLPARQDPKESAEWLHQFMKCSPTNENYVALRRKVPTPTGDDPRELMFEPFALRAEMQPQSSFSAPTFSSTWLINLQETVKHKRMIIKQRQELMNHSYRNEEISVKVKAFALQLPRENSVKKLDMGYIFAGNIISPNEEIQAIFRMRTTVIGFRDDVQMSSIVRAKTDNLIAVPTNLTCTEAVNIVRDYLPAFLAFHDSLQLSENASVIICLSSLRDRIGLATTHLALEQGASVFLYVDMDDDNISPVEKLLGFLGDSRVVITSQATFDKQISSASVNMLLFAGEMTQDNQSLKKLIGKLKPFGNIVQIHEKRGYSDTRLTSLPPNIYYLSIDMALERFKEMKARMQDAMSRLLHLFSVHNGFQALKSMAIPIAPISKLARASHTSLEEITVVVDEDNIPAALNFEDISFTASENSAYLVTGGSKGFGLKVVQWLVNCGAKQVYVISRHTPEEEAIIIFKTCRDLGARITHLKVDMTNEKEVEKALTSIHENGDVSLQGIFHCAVSYDDGFLQNLSFDSWTKVMLPKAFGALLLHKVTNKLRIDLKHFVVLSSIVEMIGNEGQGSYCAANTFLSALCTMRRKQGLPATVIAPGIINTSGFAARAGYVQSWETVGLSSLSPDEVLKGLGCVLSTDFPNLTITGAIDKREYAKAKNAMFGQHFVEKEGIFSIFKKLFPDPDSFFSAEKDIRMKIRLLPSDEAIPLILNTVTSFLVERLGLDSSISTETSPASLGLDSHMSSELSGVIHDRFGVSITAMELLNDALTIQNLCSSVYSRVQSETNITDQHDQIPNMSSKQSSTKWLKTMNDIQSPSSQLICIPSVGGGPSMFIPWVEHLSERNVQIAVVQMPGWERRERELPVQNIQDVLPQLAEAVLPCAMRGNFAFFGHSLGALLCYELSHYLQKNHNLCPSHLFVSAWYAPSVPYPHPEELEISSDVYRKMQRTLSANQEQPSISGDILPVRFSFLDQNLLNNPQLFLQMIPSIKAAILTCKRYKHRHRDRLKCGITAFGGRNDSFVVSTSLDEWAKEIMPQYRFKKLILPGKHMYLLTAGKAVLKEVFEAMQCLATETPLPRVQPKEMTEKKNDPVAVSSLKPATKIRPKVDVKEEKALSTRSSTYRPVPKPRKTSQEHQDDL